jgi:hypothetical protein
VVALPQVAESAVVVFVDPIRELKRCNLTFTPAPEFILNLSKSFGKLTLVGDSSQESELFQLRPSYRTISRHPVPWSDNWCR